MIIPLLYDSRRLRADRLLARTQRQRTAASDSRSNVTGPIAVVSAAPAAPATAAPAASACPRAARNFVTVAISTLLKLAMYETLLP